MVAPATPPLNALAGSVLETVVVSRAALPRRANAALEAAIQQEPAYRLHRARCAGHGLAVMGLKRRYLAMLSDNLHRQKLLLGNATASPWDQQAVSRKHKPARMERLVPLLEATAQKTA
jgi:hypothetical protein